MIEREFHPVADIFPMMSDREFMDLVADIREHGLREPVWLHRDGRIIDGRNRYMACRHLGVEPEMRTYTEDDSTLVAFVVSLNKHRRHLNASQLAMVAGRIAQLPVGFNQHSGEGVQIYTPSLSDAAEQMQVSRRSVAHAKKVQEQGVPELTSKVDAGELAVSTAAVIAEQTPEQQREVIAADDEKAIVKRANEIKRAKREDRKKRKEAARERAAEAAAGIAEQITHTRTESVDIAASRWWQLGDHLVYCGDSADEEFVARARGAAFAFADPPYNAGKAEWDHGFEWRHDYLAEIADVVAVTPGLSSIADFFRATKMPYRWSMSAWITNGMTRGALGFGNWIYLALFSDVESLHRNAQDHLRITVDASTTEDTSHESRKPARLLVDLLQLFTAEGDTVVDPFLGSGTTLFAAEQTGRRCIGAEINPAYSAEIIARYGQQARPL